MCLAALAVSYYTLVHVNLTEFMVSRVYLVMCSNPQLGPCVTRWRHNSDTRMTSHVPHFCTTPSGALVYLVHHVTLIARDDLRLYYVIPFQQAKVNCNS